MPADNERLRLPLTHKPMPLRVSAQLAVKGPQAAAPRGPRKRSRIASDSVGADYGTPSLPRAWQAVGRMKVRPGGPGAEQLAAEKERPKSSGGNSRRRREQRKTPSGRITADKLTTVGKSKEKEQAPAGKRVKYSSGAAAATSTTEESVAGRKSRTGSFANLPSASVALKRGHHQTKQSCPQISL